MKDCMIVRVQDIPHEGLELDFSLNLEQLCERVNLHLTDTIDNSVMQPQYNFQEPVPVHLSLHSDGRTVDIKGKLSSSYTTLCSRCISEAKQTIDLPFDLIAKPKQNNHDEDDVGFALYKGDDLDCNQVVEDILVLSLPSYTLCKEDCKGLCPSCGVNLNITQCVCTKAATEPSEVKSSPFAKLKDLKIN